VDLLGFANQIALSRSDIREHMGEQAVERLASLERALRLIEQERSRYPQLYPTGLHYVRVNDALFLGIDAEHLSPPKGQITLTGGYSIDELRRERPRRGSDIAKGTLRDSAGDVAKFLGLVARVHDYVNAQEAQHSLPGCRTVVASGLRKRFEDRQGNDDFFAANFSLSVAYEAQAKGSAIGLKGNSLYVEHDVAIAVSYIEVCHAIMASAKFLSLSSAVVDPYQYYPAKDGQVILRGGSWRVHDPIVVELLNQERVFRRLNPSVLTNLQLFADYRQIAFENNDNKRLGELVRDALNNATPTAEELNDPLREAKGSLFVRLYFSLDKDYEQFFGRNKTRRRRGKA